MGTRTRAGQRNGESCIEYMRRAIGHLDHEPETMLDDLTSPEAVLDFFDLWKTYGTDFWDGCMEGIASGDSPAPARAFVAKHSLPAWWSECIDRALSMRETA